MSKDKREKVIEAAKKSFSMFGYKATTIEQIAKIAGVGKGTIYTYFSNKEELLQEILDNLMEEMRESASKAIDPERDFGKNLHHAIYSILIYRKEHGLLLKLAEEVKEIGTQAAVDALQAIEDSIITFIKSQLNQAIEKGKIRDCNSELTAFAMIKMYVALVLDWEKKHEPLSNEQVLDFFERYLMMGLENEHSGGNDK
ncbi:TetR/AcrR family transcriptional regulator [Bacillus tianshenii]|nr:TetR/AcrR family transcriptional regulator [Bacillus tianshenii]